MPDMIQDLVITPFENGTIILQGEIHRDNVLDMVEALIDKPIPYFSELLIDVTKLEIESGLTLLTLVNTLRALSKRVSKLTVCGAPKPLQNSMYSTGLLSGDNPIVLTDKRTEIAEPA